MPKILLTQGKFSLIDKEFLHLSKSKWRFKNGYAIKYMPMGRKGSPTMGLHNAVIGFPGDGFVVDHINGDRLDNRIKNLRFVTFRENSQNRKEHRGEKKKSSKYIGVDLNRGRWRAQIQINGKRKHLGLYGEEELAAEAYQFGIKKLKNRIRKKRICNVHVKRIDQLEAVCKELMGSLHDVSRHSVPPFIGEKWMIYIREVALENISKATAILEKK